MLVPIVFNLFALWIEIGSKTLLQVLSGTYTCFTGFTCNPLPKILFEIFRASFALAILALLTIVLLTRRFIYQLNNALRFSFRLLLIGSVSVIFRYVSGFFMPLSWLTTFNDYLLGFPVSPIAVFWSWILVFPIIFIVLYVRIQQQDRQTKRDSETNQLPEIK